MNLHLDSVTVTVPDGRDTRTICDEISLSVEPGEVVALTGASGSGKSTLLAVAALLLRPDSGKVTVAGVEATDLSDAERTRLRRDHIGIVYQAASLFPSLTAREQVRLVAHISGNLNDTTKNADELLERVGLTDRADARPAELSGGERQRVGIARALMGSPSVLLADEPTAALDAERGVAIMDLLTENATSMGIATVVVTHAGSARGGPDVQHRRRSPRRGPDRSRAADQGSGPAPGRRRSPRRQPQ